jgi:hypothetical protein
MKCPECGFSKPHYHMSITEAKAIIQGISAGLNTEKNR